MKYLMLRLILRFELATLFIVVHRILSTLLRRFDDSRSSYFMKHSMYHVQSDDLIKRVL